VTPSPGTATRAARLGFAGAAAAAGALLIYAALQIAGSRETLRAPAGTIPLFWRFEWAAAAAAAGGPLLWRLARAKDQEVRGRILCALLLAATGAIVGCAVLWP
jgi:hypothetical protein